VCSPFFILLRFTVKIKTFPEMLVDTLTIVNKAAAPTPKVTNSFRNECQIIVIDVIMDN